MNQTQTKKFEEITTVELIDIVIDSFYAIEDIKDDESIDKRFRVESARFENMQEYLEFVFEEKFGFHAFPWIFAFDVKKDKDYYAFMLAVSDNINERDIVKQITLSLPKNPKDIYKDKVDYIVVVNFDSCKGYEKGKKAE